MAFIACLLFYSIIIPVQFLLYLPIASPFQIRNRFNIGHNRHLLIFIISSFLINSKEINMQSAESYLWDGNPPRPAIVPISEIEIPEASTNAVLSCCCPSEVEGIVPAS